MLMTKHNSLRIKALLTTNIWLYPSELSPNEKLVLQSIILLNDKAATELSHETIINYIKLSRGTIKQTLKSLREQNIISTTRQMLGNIYIIQWTHKIFAPMFDEVTDEIYEKMIKVTGENQGKNENADYVRIDKIKQAKTDNPTYVRIAKVNPLYFFNIDYIFNKLKINQNYLSVLSYDNPKDNLLKKSDLRLRRREKPVTETEPNLHWYDDLIKPRESLPKGKAPLRIPAQVKAIMEYWKFCGLKVSKDTTKSYREDLLAIKRLLNGKLFDGKKFTIEQIKKTITDFSGAALDADYEPANIDYKAKLAQYNIRTFLCNNFAGNYSLFLHYFETPPKRVQPLLADDNPFVTTRIKKFYSKYILKVNKLPNFSPIDENKFRKATARLLEFIRNPSVQKRMNGLGLSLVETADILCECVVKYAGERRITPGWFCSDILFEETLPRYFKERGLMVE